MQFFFKFFITTAITVVCFILFFQSISISDLRESINLFLKISPIKIFELLFLLIISYSCYVGYDLIIARYLGINISWRVLSLNAIAIYSIGNSLGSLAGGAVRFALYYPMTLSAKILIKWQLASYLIYFLGIIPFFLYIFFEDQLHFLKDLRQPQPFKLLIICLLIFVFVAFLLQRKWLKVVSRVNLKRPSNSDILGAFLISCLELFFPALLFFSCFEEVNWHHLPIFLSVYGLSVFLAALGSLPAGLGAMEILSLTLLEDVLSKPEIIAGLLLFRSIFYVIPLVIGLVLLNFFRSTK